MTPFDRLGARHRRQNRDKGQNENRPPEETKPLFFVEHRSLLNLDVYMILEISRFVNLNILLITTWTIFSILRIFSGESGAFKYARGFLGINSIRTS